MSEQTGSKQSSSVQSLGGGYAFGGVLLFVVGGLLLASVNEVESTKLFIAGACLCFAWGLYLILVGGVAQGVQRSRR